jgi:hypothetical protein
MFPENTRIEGVNMDKKDGGPAFPVVGNLTSDLIESSGMSLRDWFASHATDDDILAYLAYYNNPNMMHFRITAKYAYADAMIAERNK